ncbi:UTP--glucose-1-phosphate uridylyltransferase [Granulosicoccus antarcticus IMCC3135]|uniref:UTP--glucose-1-phosphate uridylyltransferase n=2 Tax=Granulosicoccus TaxID=437504 RepID=A0A2Z2NNH2_9GAMM|nr:UTP--glucose-1-phosphate uridylyltransferase [Granulosicoccus antarcticus IMCC3135]
MSHEVVKRAVLLAAGRGKRLQPHTDITPKPLLIHKGKPTLDYLLDSLLLAGIEEVVLVTHHLHEQVEHYAALRSANHKQQVRCVYQSHLFGTAHALQAVIESAPDIVAAPFVLSATDYLVPREFFGDLLQFHGSHAGECSVSMKELDAAELASRSSIRFNDDQSIAEIVEKPAAGTAPSSTGANLTFILPPDIIPDVQNVPVSERGEQEVQHAINAWISRGGLAFGLVQAIPPEWQPS